MLTEHSPDDHIFDYEVSDGYFPDSSSRPKRKVRVTRWPEPSSNNRICAIQYEDTRQINLIPTTGLSFIGSPNRTAPQVDKSIQMECKRIALEAMRYVMRNNQEATVTATKSDILTAVNRVVDMLASLTRARQ